MEPPAESVEPTGPPAPSVPERRPHILRRLYTWVLGWADTPYGMPALATLSFAEASFFPVPPDALQMALSLGKPRRSFHFALVSLVASVLGGMVGYGIGHLVWAETQGFFFAHVFERETFERVRDIFVANDFIAVFVAALTPIPYKVFTIAAGVAGLDLRAFLLASVCGRGLRFFAVGALFFFFGPPVKRIIDRYFEWLAVAMAVLLIGGFYLLKYLR